MLENEGRVVFGQDAGYQRVKEEPVVAIGWDDRYSDEDDNGEDARDYDELEGDRETEATQMGVAMIQITARIAQARLEEFRSGIPESRKCCLCSLSRVLLLRSDHTAFLTFVGYRRTPTGEHNRVARTKIDQRGLNNATGIRGSKSSEWHGPTEHSSKTRRI